MINKVKVFLYAGITDAQIEQWAEGRNIFFVLSLGRSGTKLLADLLNEAPGTCVAHEPVIEDFRAHQEAFHSEESARNYIRHFRRKEIYLRVGKEAISTYGEVNSVLRRHCNALREAFPNATFIHLIRDGRDVVRSMISRKTMTLWDDHTRHIYPTEGDPYRTKWSDMSRFERLCWYWQVENRYLRAFVEEKVRFEELITSYEYFKQNILYPLKLEISEDVWRKVMNVRKNVTEEYKIPHWSQWDGVKLESFRKICGEEMIKNGYSL
ncbi:MAG TPA: sulfotransferase [Thermodesulfobacteriota bacterium]|nr:sulfotransferase [Thermodesulfobacteriota bacterium]